MDSKIINKLFFNNFFISSPLSAIEFKNFYKVIILLELQSNAKIIVGKKEVKVSKDGFVFGLDRDRKFDVTITKILDGKKKIH